MMETRDLAASRTRHLEIKYTLLIISTCHNYNRTLKNICSHVLCEDSIHVRLQNAVVLEKCWFKWTTVFTATGQLDFTQIVALMMYSN